MSKKILVIAAHPDDEVLGCGGTIAKHAMNGDSVAVVIMAEGITSRDPKRRRDKRGSELSELASSARKANKIIGTKSLELLKFPDNRMDSVDLLDIVKAVEELVEKHMPEIVYTHSSGDVNIDHRRIHEAVVTACRPMPGRPVKTLLFFEVPSSTEWQAPGSAMPFVPGWFVDISDAIDLKMKALDAYCAEMRPWPHARSKEAVASLARFRGASAGFEAAEAFMLGRNLVKMGKAR